MKQYKISPKSIKNLNFIDKGDFLICSVCGFKTNNKQDFIKHIQINHSKLINLNKQMTLNDF
jgi:uncharacterized C2H2 Zn-finger protein